MVSFRNTPTHYGLIARILHWTTVPLILMAVVIATQGGAMQAGSGKEVALTKHAIIGLSVLALMLARLYWRTANPNPINSYALPHWSKVLAMSLHRGLYCVVLALALTGVLQVVFRGESLGVAGRLGIGNWVAADTPFGELWHDIHVRFTYVLYVAIAVHVIAAIVHQVFGPDETEH